MKTNREKQLEAILHGVCEFYHLDLKDILGTTISPEASRGRQMAMFLAEERCRMSPEEIGAHFGGRNESVVVELIEQFCKGCQENPEIAMCLRLAKENVDAYMDAHFHS